MRERIYKEAKKIPRIEAETMRDDEVENSDLYFGNVWGEEIYRYQNYSVLQDRYLEEAKAHIQKTVENAFGYRLTQLTQEIVNDATLFDMIAIVAPHIHRTKEVFTLVSYLKKQLDYSEKSLRELRREAAVASLQFWRKAELPNDLWIAIAKKHLKEFKKTEKKFERAEIKRIVASVQENISREVIRNTLPIPRERLEKVLSTTEVLLGDDLHPSMEEASGFYRRINNSITVSSSAIDDIPLLKNVLTHEYMHALEGRTILRGAYITDFIEDAEESDELELDPIHRHEVVRGGLSIDKGPLGLSPYPRFKWMNESVTELITDELLPNNKHKTYLEYRRALDYVMNEGNRLISLAMFKKAYFEDYEPGASKKIRHWKILRSAINEAHGPGFLVKFDDAINSLGANVAIEKAREGTL